MRRRVVVPLGMHFSYLDLLEPHLMFLLSQIILLLYLIGWAQIIEIMLIVTKEFLALH